MFKAKVQFENECAYIKATMRDYQAWTNGTLLDNTSAFNKYDINKYWAYCDYKYMINLVRGSIIDECVII